MACPCEHTIHVEFSLGHFDWPRYGHQFDFQRMTYAQDLTFGLRLAFALGLELLVALSSALLGYLVFLFAFLPSLSALPCCLALACRRYFARAPSRSCVPCCLALPCPCLATLCSCHQDYRVIFAQISACICEHVLFISRSRSGRKPYYTRSRIQVSGRLPFFCFIWTSGAFPGGWPMLIY